MLFLIEHTQTEIVQLFVPSVVHTRLCNKEPHKFWGLLFKFVAASDFK